MSFSGAGIRDHCREAEPGNVVQMACRMLNHRELGSLLAAMRKSRVTTLEFKHQKQRLRLEVPPSGNSPTVHPATTTAQLTAVLPAAEPVTADSPIIGTFLQRGIGDGLALLESGQPVMAGEILGYVCHGPVRVIVHAPVSGVLRDEGPRDGTVMGVGDTVFNLDVTP